MRNFDKEYLLTTLNFAEVSELVTHLLSSDRTLVIVSHKNLGRPNLTWNMASGLKLEGTIEQASRTYVTEAMASMAIDFDTDTLLLSTSHSLSATASRAWDRRNLSVEGETVTRVRFNGRLEAFGRRDCVEVEHWNGGYGVSTTVTFL